MEQLTCHSSALYRRLTLPACFQDGMVLQCEKPIRVWGTALPHEGIRVGVDNHTSSTLADENGNFEVALAPLPPGGPVTLFVEASDFRVEFHDVLLGEVWLCAGQSNMLWSLEKCTSAEELVEASDYPEIRLCTLPGTQGIPRDTPVRWEICSPQTTPRFSAVAYLYGRRLYQALKRPIGLILAAWSGSHIEAWMSEEALLNTNKSQCDLQNYLISRANGEVPRPLLFPRANWEDSQYTDEQWPFISIPRPWQDAGLFCHGSVWFRRKVSLPDQWQELDLHLQLGRCADSEQVFFNGHPLSSIPTENAAHTPSQYVIPKNYTQPGENILTVRVESWREGSGLLGPADAMYLCAKDDASDVRVALAGDWQYKAETKLPMRNLTVQDWLQAPEKGPHALFDATIATIVPLAIRGVLWYQGEQNAWRAADYSKLLVGLIRDWRSRWDDPFPFLFVQLPNAKVRTKDPKCTDWAELREAQASALAEPATAMAVAIDCGEEDLHPKDKRVIAERLASAALARVYGMAAPHLSPRYLRHQIRKNSIAIEFTVESGALKTRDSQAVRGFQISGNNQVFVDASADLVGTSVVVFSSDVTEPVAVRYAWANNPDCNLCDEQGLPAAPFRTDKWCRVTADQI